MKKFLAFIFILSIWAIGGNSADGQPADGCPRGFVERLEPGKTSPTVDTFSICSPRAYFQALVDGVVIGEASIEAEEIEVIIQLEGEPLGRLRGPKASLFSAAMELEGIRGWVKGEILRVENEIRSAKGLPHRLPREMREREFQRVFHGIATRITREALPRIERLPGVKKVWPDGKVKATLADSVPRIGADRVWKEIGAKGRGITVAVIDTGIDYTHPDLGGCLGPNCKVIGGYDFVNRDRDPMDDNGHGTHVAGIIGANGTLKGVAPEVKLMALKALDQYGSGAFSWVIAAIEKALDPDGNLYTDDGVQVINLSLGGSGDPDDPLSQAVDNAVRSGAVVVVAAGNSGPSYETLNTPGCARLALTVGASDKSDRIATFSSRGPAAKTYQIKPEVMAPGVGIWSTVPRGICNLCDGSGFKSLNGTSMATPHVSGVAALLLEKFPDISPQRVKELLMERAVDLSADLFTQGNGRVDAYSSIVSPTFISPGSLSLGLDPIDQPIFQITRIFNFTNSGNDTETYDLSVQGIFPEGISTELRPTILRLAPGETRSFSFTLTVDNGRVPDPMNLTHSYSGAIVASGPWDSIRIPFAFLKSPLLEITLDEAPTIMVVHNRENLVKWIPQPGISRTLMLPKGTYDVIGIFGGGERRVVREGIPLATKSSIRISKAEAIHPFTIVPVDEKGNFHSLSPNNMMVCHFKHKGARFTEVSYNWGVAPSFHFSNLSDQYQFEVSLLDQKNRLKGPTYVYHGHAREGIQGPIKFQNTPQDLKRVLFRHQMEPGVTHAYPFQTFGSVTGYMSLQTRADQPIPFPFEEELFMTPSPYLNFDLGFIRKELFPSKGALGIPADSDPSFITPFYRVADRNRLEGYFFDPSQPESSGYRRLVLSSSETELPSGIGPLFWVGRFENHPSFIRLKSSWAANSWLFLGPLMDLRPHDPLPYELYRDGKKVASGSLSGAGNPYSSKPDLIVPLPSTSPGIYSLRIPFDHFFIAGKASSVFLEAFFDPGKTDPNPPALLSFKITDDGKTTDVIQHGKGQIHFKVMDDRGIRQISLLYDAGNGWQAFALASIGEGEYQAKVPNFSKDTFLAFRLDVEDTSGNRIIYEINPAVFVKATPAGNQPLFAVNCGGPSYTDKNGVVYQADTFYAGGGTYKSAAAIDGTEDDLLYQSERFGNFSYNIPLPNGNYTVTLKFAEIYYSCAGARVFDVKIEGKEVISNLDLWRKVGKNKAWDVILPVTVSDGVLNIEFHTDIGNAKISAIAVTGMQAPATLRITAKAGPGGTIQPQGEVLVPWGGTQAFTIKPDEGFRIADLKVDGQSQGPMASYSFMNVTADHSIEALFEPSQFEFILGINCGGPQYTDKNGWVYQPDSFFTGGGTYKSAAGIDGTEDDFLYQSERFGNFSYNIPLPNGNYTVTLKFAEIYYSWASARIFDVKMEGKDGISNLDIFRRVGKNKALDISIPVSVTDGILNLEFQSPGGNAKIGAILITK